MSDFLLSVVLFSRTIMQAFLDEKQNDFTYLVSWCLLKQQKPVNGARKINLIQKENNFLVLFYA